MTFTSRQGSLAMLINCETIPAFLNFRTRPAAPGQNVVRFNRTQTDAVRNWLSLLCKNLTINGCVFIPPCWNSCSMTASLWTLLPLATLLSAYIPCKRGMLGFIYMQKWCHYNSSWSLEHQEILILNLQFWWNKINMALRQPVLKSGFQNGM